MSQISIKQAVSMGELAVIPQLGPVTFQSVYPTRSGTSKSGDAYSVTDAVLTDGETEVRAAFWDCPDLSQFKGQTKVIHSVKGKNGRLTGVTVKVGKDKEGKNRWEMSVSKNALILDPEVQVSPSADPPASVPTPMQPAKITPIDPLPGSIAEKAKASTVAAVVRASALPGKATFEDVLALFTHCYQAAQNIVPDSGDGAGLQARQAAAATLFIASTNNGLLAGANQRYPTGTGTAKTDLPL